jgi:hypothetical protein
LRWMISFFLLSNFLVTPCRSSSSNVPIEISSRGTSTITVTSTLVRTSTPTTQLVKLTSTPTTTPKSTFTPRVPSTEIQKSVDIPVTELHLRLKNSKGEPVPFSKAELLMDTWTLAPTFPLDTDGNLLVLPLEEKVVRELWMKDLPEDNILHRYFLYFEAKGYTAVRSEKIWFIGSQIGVDEPDDEVVIEFHNGPRARILKGEKQEIELILREPQERRLRFIDDSQNPVPGVKVRSYMFWSSSNHCGNPQGANFLAEGVSDEEGFINIPDGEFEYLLEFEKPLYHLKEPMKGIAPMRLITYLSNQEIVIELHKLNKKPLELFVQKDGEPQPNKTLYGQWIGCPCGLCEHEIAVTDENGKISLDEFYPEEWEWLFFIKGDQFGAGSWQANPKEFSGTEVIEVELSE